MSNIEEWFVFGLKATGVLWLVWHSKKIFELIRESFGRIDKAELAGMIFTPVMIWMIWSEKHRLLEWHLFDDFMFGTVAFIVCYGFGLKPLISAFLSLRGIKLPQDEKTNTASHPRKSGNHDTPPAEGEHP